MKIDPNKHQFVPKFKEAVPEAKRIDFKKIGVKERSLYQYVTLMYDLNSPLWREVPDYYNRKYDAALLAKFPILESGEFSKRAEGVILGTYEEVNAVIVSYIASFALPEYYQMIAYTALLSQETKNILANDGSNNSIKVIEEAGNRLKVLQKKLFHSGDYDEYASLRKSLYFRLNHEREQLNLRPEEIVKKFQKDGKLPKDFSPYGEVPDEMWAATMKFVGDK